MARPSFYGHVTEPIIKNGSYNDGAFLRTTDCDHLRTLANGTVDSQAECVIPVGMGCMRFQTDAGQLRWG